MGECFEQIKENGHNHRIAINNLAIFQRQFKELEKVADGGSLSAKSACNHLNTLVTSLVSVSSYCVITDMEQIKEIPEP